MIPFKLRLHLATPFFCSDSLTLDGLLSAAVFNATGLQGEETIEHIPLARENGIFRASSLFCSPNYRHVTVGRIMSLRTENDLSSTLFAPNKRGKDYAYVDQQRGDYKANMSSYPGIESPEVYFWGVGDPDKVCQLIRDFIPGIGKRATGGAGEIVSVDWIETDEDFSWMTRKGMPARPLPVEIWQGLGGKENLPVEKKAVTVPYWSTPKVDCVFPADVAA